MAGPLLNPKCVIIPLPFRCRICQFMATPETLPAEIGKRVLSSCESWDLWTGFHGKELALCFDTERVVHYEPGNQTPWTAAHSDALLMTLPRTRGNMGSWNGAAIMLGPGWESYAADIYWSAARAIRKFLLDEYSSTENEQVVLVALESMMRSHGRI